MIFDCSKIFEKAGILLKLFIAWLGLAWLGLAWLGLAWLEFIQKLNCS